MNIETQKPSEATLRTTVEEAHQLATAKPTQKNRRALKKAQRVLDDYLGSLTIPEDLLQNIPALVEYLDGEHYKIGLSTAYEHRDQGKLKLKEDGTITKTMALEYANNELQKRDGRKKESSTRQLRDQEETRRIRADADMRELNYKVRSGELIDKSHVEVELAARATNLKAYLDSVARQSAGRIVKLVKGDPQLIPHLIEFMLGTNRRAFDNYARPILTEEDED